MVLSFPRDIVFEVFLGQWVDISTLPKLRSLRTVDPTTITWGLPNEQRGSLCPPSTVEGVLNNTGGHWTPGNPMSDYYEYLRSRNVPTRLSLRVSRDAFGRTLPTSLGPTDTGEVWSTSGVNDSYSVGSGVGNIAISAVASFGLAIIGDSYPDCEGRITFDVGGITPTGAPIEPGNVVMRYQASGPFIGEHYMLRVEVRTDQVVQLTIVHSSLGALTGTVSVGTNAAGRKWRVAFYAEGQTLRGKCWEIASPEPVGWQISVHDTRLSGGFPGFRAGVAAGNTNTKPVTMAHDNWELLLRRHTGELAYLQPSWDESHRGKKAAFKCADITQRLGRPQRPALQSAPRRYLTSNAQFTATDVWPLDESATDSAPGLNAISAGRPAQFLRYNAISISPATPDRGAAKWGDPDPNFPVVPAAVQLSNDGNLSMYPNQTPLGSAWSFMLALKLAPDMGSFIFMSTPAVTSRFTFLLYTDGTYDLFSNPSGSSVSNGFLYPAGFDGSWVTLGVTTFPSGADTDARVFVNGENRGGGLIAADAGYSPLSRIIINAGQATVGGQGTAAFSSAFVTASRLDTFVSGETIGAHAHRAIMGWVGERATARALRLSTEEGVPFDYYGSSTDSRPMGPQRPIPLLDSLAECAEVDGGILYAPRYSGGVALRPRRSMCARPVDATLSYSSKQVSPPFSSSADDRPTANQVTAERLSGGTVTVEQVTGPMNTGDPGTDLDAAGLSPAEVKVNVQSDVQLGDIAGWVRALGTVPEIRFPRVSVNFQALAMRVPSLTTARAVMTLHVGDRLQITGLTQADIYRDLDQIVLGAREILGGIKEHQLILNTAPYEKYRTATFGDASSRYDGAVTTLDAQLTSGTTGARNITVTSGPRWTTTTGSYPLDVIIGGERITISGVTGTGTAQVMTISARNVNALPTAGGKTHPAGTRVSLYQPVYYC